MESTESKNNRIDKIEDDIDKLQITQAKCRGPEQIKDHDILNTLSAKHDSLQTEVTEAKKTNTKEHDKITDKLETVSGNINQAMMYIKDMQKNAHIKVGFRTAVIAGVLSTVIAAGIIYIASNFYENAKAKLTKKQDQELLLNISKQVMENSKHMKILSEKSPVYIKVEEKTE